MGYSVPEHFSALDRLGPTVHHRRSFSPVALALGELAADIDGGGSRHIASLRARPYSHAFVIPGRAKGASPDVIITDPRGRYRSATFVESWLWIPALACYARSAGMT